MHAHDPGEGDDDGAEPDPTLQQALMEEEQAVRGTKSILLQVPPTPIRPEPSSLQSWDVLMHNVNKFTK